MRLFQLNLADLDVNMFSAVNNSLINDGCGLYRGRLILPYEHLSRFQNDIVGLIRYYRYSMEIRMSFSFASTTAMLPDTRGT